MQHYYALSSIIYMMGFVIVFESYHHRKKLERLFRSICFQPGRGGPDPRDLGGLPGNVIP